MSIIIEFTTRAKAFELGRILRVGPGVRIELASMVPLGESMVPLFWRHDSGSAAFEGDVRSHPSVEEVLMVESLEDRTLYALEWNGEADDLLAGIGAQNGQLLNAVGSTAGWEFEVRFPDHDTISVFREYCDRAGIGIEVLRVFNPTRPDAGPWYGLTQPQREALTLAVEEGYYAIPRQCTTVELAEYLGISDQAVTERLRRGIDKLVRNTLVVGDGKE